MQPIEPDRVFLAAVEKGRERAARENGVILVWSVGHTFFVRGATGAPPAAGILEALIFPEGVVRPISDRAGQLLHSR